MRVAVAILAILTLTFVLHVLIPVNATTVGFVYLITVLVIAASWGLTEAVLASITATACFNYFFLPPTYTWTITDPENWVALFTLLASSLLASQLSNSAKTRAVEATNRQMELQRLYALSRAWMLMDTQQSAPKQIAEQVARIYETPQVAIYDSRTGEFFSTSEPCNLDKPMPLVLADQTIGSFAIRTETLSATALDALRNLIAINLESVRSRDVATRAEAERRSEHFKSTLLDGVAHEFKTPLTSIKAVTTALLSSSVPNVAQQHELLTIVDQEADRLSQLVTEAIHLARLEAGKIQLKREMHSIVNVVQAALEQTTAARNGRSVELSIAEGIPSAAIDRDLVQLSIRQLLENAFKYSPHRSPVRLAVSAGNERIAVAIHNGGEPLSDLEQTRIFDKFYRGQNAQGLTGAGMGLSIAREIFRAHGGDIRVESGPDRGTEFVALLPCKAEKEVENEFVASPHRR